MNRKEFEKELDKHWAAVKAVILERNKEYCPEDDALATYRSSERHGVLPHVSLSLRMEEKMARLAQANNASLLPGKDIPIDLIGYCVHMLLFLEEAKTLNTLTKDS